MISHRHQCVFIHVPKTAGKSVLALFGLPEFGRDYTTPLPYIEDPYDHVPIRRYLGAPFFAAYWKFAVVRNPWDRLVSAFSYLDAGGCNAFDAQYRQRYLACYGGRFDLFLRDLDQFIAHKHFLPQSVFVCGDDGTTLVDEIVRYEELDVAMARLKTRLGLAPGPLPHRNASRHRPYRECYTRETWERVAGAYAVDLRNFGYEDGFEGLTANDRIVAAR